MEDRAWGRVTFERLNDFNWASWKFRMELLLVERGVWDVSNTAKPGDLTDAQELQWTNNDAKARATIGLAIETNQLCHLHEAKTAFEMWKALKGHHQRTSLTNKVFVYRQLFKLCLSEGGNMSEHLNEISSLANRLSAMGEKVADHLVIAIMLSSLPDSYRSLVTSIETRLESQLKVPYVRGQLLDEWRRRKELSDHGGGSGKSAESALKMSVRQKKSAKPKTCHYCKMEGHFRRDCHKYAADQQTKQQKKTATAKSAMKSEEFHCYSTGAKKIDEKWCLDSGASAHMTNNIKHFVSLAAPRKVAIVRLADGTKHPVEGIGSCVIKTISENEEEVTVNLHNVQYVPGLDSSLVSVARLADNGCDVLFEKNLCRIRRNGSFVLTGERRDDVYWLKQAKCHTSSLSVVPPVPHSDHCLHLWHRRLGHRHHDAVKRIVNENLGEDMKLRDCGVRSECTVCLEGKLARRPFPKVSLSKSAAVLDLVHTDLCGPLSVATVGGRRYLLTMIDDFSKFTVVYLLKEKSQTCEKIRDYVNFVSNKFGTNPKVLRSDGGGEYNSTELACYLKEKGIVLQQTAPYSPQQNGTAERKNRSLIEMTRCLLAESGLDDIYWGEAVMTANYLQNRLPSASIDRTPYEHWHDQKRRKLDKKAVRLAFVGYEENRKAYRFLDLETKKITISRDAKFLEMELKPQESVSGVKPKRQLLIDLPVPASELVPNEASEAVPEAANVPALPATDDATRQEEEQSDANEADPDATLVSAGDESIYDDAEENLGEISSDSLFRGFQPELAS